MAIMGKRELKYGKIRGWLCQPVCFLSTPFLIIRIYQIYFYLTEKQKYAASPVHLPIYDHTEWSHAGGYNDTAGRWTGEAA